MIKLALANDNTIPPDITEAISDLLEGRLAMNQTVSADEPLLMTMTAAANLLGVSRVTMWRMVKTGILKPVEITPRVFRMSRHDIKKFVDRHSKYLPVKRGPGMQANTPPATVS